MNVNLEQIDELRARAKVSYSDAKEALERCNNDMVEALIYLEQQKKMGSASNTGDSQSSFLDSCVALIKKGNKTKFIIKKQSSVLLSIPVTAAVLITIFAPYVTLIGVPAALLTGHKIRLEKNNGEDMEVNKVFDKVSDTVIVAKEAVMKNIHEQNNNIDRSI